MAIVLSPPRSRAPPMHDGCRLKTALRCAVFPHSPFNIPHSPPPRRAVPVRKRSVPLIKGDHRGLPRNPATCPRPPTRRASRIPSKHKMDSAKRSQKTALETPKTPIPPKKRTQTNPPPIRKGRRSPDVHRDEDPDPAPKGGHRETRNGELRILTRPKKVVHREFRYYEFAIRYSPSRFTG